MRTVSHHAGFAELGVRPRLVEALHDRGITTAFAVQELVIPDALAGRDVAAEAPTGSGKTLAFGIPVIERIEHGGPTRPGRPVALVLAPTRELARQIGTTLAPLARAMSRAVHVFHGGAAFEPQITACQRGVDIAVATPGRLLDLIGQGCISLADVELAVVDEADRLADLGFLPDVRQLLDMTRPDRQVLLLSATLDGDVETLVDDYQRDPVVHVVTPPEVRPIRHLVWFVDDRDRGELLLALVRHCGPAIVFCSTRSGAERVATTLRSRRVGAVALHGRNSQAKREAALEEFRSGRAHVLVATDVAARGIHVDDVACVIQHELPTDPKDYVHRAGRTGRAGAVGTVVSFVPPTERDRAVAVLRSAGIDAELGEPDLSAVESADVRRAVERELAALDELKPPGTVGGVRFENPVETTHSGGLECR